MTDTQQPRFIVSKSTPDYAGYDLEVSTGTGLSDDQCGIRAAWRIDGATSDYEAQAALLSSLGYGAVMDRITITRLIPREFDESERLDAARNVLRADYWQDVENVISWLRHEIENGNITDADGATEYIDETVDSHQRVIYTGQAIECLLFSRNENAYVEEMGELPPRSPGDEVNWSALAYYAFRADIMDAIGDLDAFVDEHEPKHYAECDDCGDDIETEADAHIYADEDVTVCADCAEYREDEKKQDA